MYKKILVPMALDHGISPQSLSVANALVEEGGEVIGLHIYEMPQESVSAFLDEAAVKAAYEEAKRKQQEKLSDMPNVVPVIMTGHPARSIVDYASQHGVDCIIVGSHKPGLSDFFLGSTASRVVRHAKCAVHVTR